MTMMKRMVVFLIAVTVLVLLGGSASAVEYKWTGDGFVMTVPTAADETAITETELLASGPRRTVTRTTTTATGWAAIPATTEISHTRSAGACATTATASTCSSSSTRTVTRSSVRTFAPVRRLFGLRLRGGC